MRFAPAEMESSTEKAHIEAQLSKLGSELAKVAEKLKEVESPQGIQSVILEMERLRAEAAPLEAALRRMRVLEQTEGVEAGLKKEAVKMVEQRAANAEAIKETQKQIEALSSELKQAEKKLESASGAAVLDALTNVDIIQAQITALEASVRSKAIDNLDLASDLHTLKEKGITQEKIDFTAAEQDWLEGGKNRSDFWEMELGEREKMIDGLEKEFFAEAA